MDKTAKALAAGTVGGKGSPRQFPENPLQTTIIAIISSYFPTSKVITLSK